MTAITFKIIPLEWNNYTLNIAKESKKLLEEGKHVNLNHTNVASDLMEQFLDGKIQVELAPIEKEGTKIKGIIPSAELWRRAKDYVTKRQSEGNKINGGLGGLVINLVKAYNRGEIKPFQEVK